MAVVDLSVVNVALPRIQSGLRLGVSELQWVVVAYGLTIGGFLLLGGRAGDLGGHRRLLVAGLALLAGASVVTGLSHSFPVLVAGRAAQGLGAAFATPNALAILTGAFREGPERNRALGIFGAVGGTAAAAGSVIGGLLVTGAGWRWVFFINLPVGALLIAVVVLALPPDGREQRQGAIDLAGAIALTAGLMALVLGLHEGSAHGWDAAQTLGAFAVGGALLVVFVQIERRTEMPLVPLGSLRRPQLLRANVVSWLLWAGFLGFIYLATLFTQQQLHYSPLGAGAAGLVIAVVSLAVSARVAPRVLDRHGAGRTLVLGQVLLAVGLLLLLRVPRTASYWSDLAPAYAFIGLGIGFSQVAVQVAAFAGVPSEEAGLAGGLVETSSEFGGAFGVALVVSLSLASTRHSPLSAFHEGALICAVLALAAGAVALLLPGRIDGLHGADEAAGVQAAGVTGDFGGANGSGPTTTKPTDRRGSRP